MRRAGLVLSRCSIEFCCKLGLNAARCIFEFNFGPRHVSQHRVQPLRSQYYETELDYKLKKLTSLFEPVIIVVMGLMVGFVAIALVSAMYGVFRQVSV